MAGVKINFAPVFLCLLLIHAANAQPKAPVADEVQIEVRATKQKFAGGEPVVLTIVLRNNTPKPITFLMRPADFEFKVRFIRAGSGRNLKGVLTKRGDEERKGGAMGQLLVPANAERETRVVLSRAFDMTRAGTYSIVGNKNLKLDFVAPGGTLIGAAKVAREIKVVVSEEDVLAAP